MYLGLELLYDMILNLGAEMECVGPSRYSFVLRSMMILIIWNTLATLALFWFAR